MEQIPRTSCKVTRRLVTVYPTVVPGSPMTGPFANSPEGVKSGNGVRKLDDAEQSEEPR